jgi:hypothetical protein
MAWWRGRYNFLPGLLWVYDDQNPTRVILQGEETPKSRYLSSKERLNRVDESCRRFIPRMVTVEKREDPIKAI